MKSKNLLPDDIIKYILSFLDIKELAKYRLISHDFKRVAEIFYRTESKKLFFYDRETIPQLLNYMKYHIYLVAQKEKRLVDRAIDNYCNQVLQSFNLFDKSSKNQPRLEYDSVQKNFVLTTKLNGVATNYLKSQIQKNVLFNKTCEFIETSPETYKLIINPQSLKYHCLENLALQVAYYSLKPKEKVEFFQQYINSFGSYLITPIRTYQSAKNLETLVVLKSESGLENLLNQHPDLYSVRIGSNRRSRMAFTLTSLGKICLSKAVELPKCKNFLQEKIKEFHINLNNNEKKPMVTL